MASFVVDLWESIFTPGPTSTLLKATNLSFAALQLVLLLLLLATASIHCVVLSVLCAGLWWSVNWFAAELAAHQRAEAAKKEAAKKEEEEEEEEEEEQQQKQRAPETTEDSETEVETTIIDKGKEEEKKKKKKKKKKEPGLGRAEVAEAGVEAVEAQGEVKHRGPVSSTPPAPGTQSSVSTEDEWEKVSENENEKDK